MQFQFSNCLPGKDSSPTEKRFDLRPASTPAQLSALDLESIESGMAHTDLADFASGQYSARGQVALCIEEVQTTTRSDQTTSR